MRLRLAVVSISLWTTFCAAHAMAACGDKITVGGVAIVVPAVVTWDTNVGEAIQVAKIKRKPFAIYFVSKENSKVVGEPIDVIKEYMKANNNTVPDCVAAVPVAVEQAREMGVGNFVKVPIQKVNKETVQKYGGEDNTLIICTPDGEKIIAVKCTSDALKSLDPVRKEMADWQAAHPRR